jgi:prophage DNA circulation protein
VSWRDRLSRASFRGFEFLTESHDAKGGRRLAVHEYPGAEIPGVEDLGGKAWEWKLNAYFIGPDYDLERNGLLEKLNEPGAAWLNHPWLGLLWVRAQRWSLHESTDKGGFCTIAIEFVPSGETVQPTQDLVDVAFDRTRKLADVVVADFTLEAMSAGGMTSFVAAVEGKLEGLRQMMSLATLPLTLANQVTGLIAGIKGELAALMAIPAAYAFALRNLTTTLGAGANDSDLADTERPRVVARYARAATAKSAVALSGVAATDGAARRNGLRAEALQSRLLVTAAAETALTNYRAEGDRDAVLTTVTAAIDALLPSLPDAVFQAAVTARAAVAEALLAQDLKPAASRKVVTPLPAVVLAHRLGVDVAVFLARNAVRHPLFVRGHIDG